MVPFTKEGSRGKEQFQRVQLMPELYEFFKFMFSF